MLVASSLFVLAVWPFTSTCPPAACPAAPTATHCPAPPPVNTSAGHEQPGSTPDDVQCFERGAPETLRSAWLNYNDKTRHLLHRILEHADHYQRHLPPRADPSGAQRPLKMLEMGVQSGGSARMWRSWYGPRLTYVGLDIDVGVKRSHSPAENIFIEVGSQTDPKLLARICAKYGPFDIVVDDGGHTPELIRGSLALLYPEAAKCMTSPSSTYVIEDTQTMLQRSHVGRGYASDMYSIVGEAFYALHAPNLDAQYELRSKLRPTGEALVGELETLPVEDGGGRFPRDQLVRPHPVFGDLISGVHAYDTIVFFTRAKHRAVSSVKRPQRGASLLEMNTNGATRIFHPATEKEEEERVVHKAERAQALRAERKAKENAARARGGAAKAHNGGGKAANKPAAAAK